MTDRRSPAGPLVRYAEAPRAAWDRRFFQPLLDAEARRGNPGEWRFGDLHVSSAAILFRGPLDAKAIRAEFELDEGMSIRTTSATGLFYDDRDGEIALVVSGAWAEPDGAMTQAREAWWREWRSRPRPLTTLRNPFVHPDAFPPIAVARPVILDRVPEQVQLGASMSPDLPGLGNGWSVWPFTAPALSGLLVIAPNWFDETTARAAVEDSGGTELPVLLVIRGREPEPVETALREARAESKYLL